MGEWKADIRYAIKQISGVENQLSTLLVCEVVSVDMALRTCVVTVMSGETEYEIPDVQLQASADDGFIIYPAVGSTVIVANEIKMPCYVVMYSEVSKVLASQPLWQFNDGKNKGIVKVIELTEKVNALENLMNDLQDKFNAWAPLAGDGGGALKTILTVTPPIWNLPQITLTKQSDLEDTKVTH